MIRKTLSISLALLATMFVLNLAACDSSDPVDDAGGRDTGRDTTGDDTGRDTGTDTGVDAGVDMTGDGPGPDTDGGGKFPPAPALGTTQIDRLGRPAVNTALTNPFYDHIGGGAAHATIQDAYNSSADPADWRAFAADFATPLAAFDSLDGVCGNSVGTPVAGIGTGDATRYATIAAALADDRLFVNTGSGTCEAFLGVEAATLAALQFNGGAANNDCGGRTPTQDTISILYSLLSGAFQSLGLPAIPTYTGSAPDTGASNSAFPWLADPT